ncbi:hypothetical protein GCM10009792_24130 [Microcella alkalica]|uniref:Uncharacterized protein n=1 Tax=Microcella alkalica TaxID=355930 RepID=A0A839EA52_9MICO|nr:hypothetical protein [Microcella alkalica]MBA8848357.1 hypothetical protein [Microcella alkalica]
MDTDSDRILIPGENFPPWPSIKLDYAQSLGRELNDRVNAWRERLGAESASEIAADGKSGIVRARLIEPPPIIEWALLFGDVLHNYRSALDALVWELAHLDGLIPHERVVRSIYFPLATSRTQWKKISERQLASVPQFALDRLARVQPFHAQPVEKGIGLTLHRLDIENKHRSVVDMTLSAVDKSSFAVVVKHREEPPVGVDGEPDWEWNAPESGITDGDEVLHFWSEDAIEEFLVPHLPLSVVVRDGEDPRELWDLLRHVDAQVVATFNTVYLGYDTEDHIQFISDRGLRLGAPSIDPE